jgi:hypothetical protein
MSNWTLASGPTGSVDGEPPKSTRAGWSRTANMTSEGGAMGKRARKKKDRRKNKANHGKRPNT